MAGQVTGSILEDFLTQASRPPALAAMALMLTLYGAEAFYLSRAMTSISSGGAGQLGMIMTAIGLVTGLIAFVVLFLLSRALVSDTGQSGPPLIGAFVGFSLLYALINRALVGLAGGLASLFMYENYQLIAYLTAGVGMLLRIVLFPFLIFLVGLAHGQRQPGFGKIWSYVTGVRPALYGGYVLLCLAAAALPMVANIVGAGLAAGQSTSVMMVGSYLIGGAGQVLAFVYAIAAYRAVDRDSGGASDVFG